MLCRDVEPELVAWERDELAAEDAARVAEHVERCAACRARVGEIRRTLEVVRMGLVAMEPSADFRLRLRERIKRAGAAGAAGAGARSSRRFLTLQRPEERPGWRAAMRERLRTSPYFALSIAAHAAVILIVIGWAALEWSASDAPDAARPPLEGPRVTQTPAQALRNVRARAWQKRLPYASRRIALGQVRRAKAAYVAGDPEDGCVWVYPVEGERVPAEADFLARITPQKRGLFTRVATEAGDLPVPADLAEAYLADAEEVVVVDLLDVPKKERLEVWSPDRWAAYIGSDAAAREASAHRAVRVPASLLAAILPAMDRRR